MNLLSNAFKYSLKRQNPKLAATFTDTEVTITVSDNGIGIPKADHANLFQPFQRARNVGEVAGTGLGLAIVKEYVERNGGTISIQSAENEGTIFTIIFRKQS